MKKILLASAALAMTAGYAAAEVTVGGDGRMGLFYDGSDWEFTSRVRISFTASGETDGGLAFGASVRADQAGNYIDSDADDDDDAGGGVGNDRMDRGTIYISGAFGKLTFGDNDSAAKQAVGEVGAISLTGLGDAQEIGYEGHTDTSVAYSYSNNGLGLYLSAGQISSDEVSVGVSYGMGDYSFGLGWESAGGADVWYVGANATFSNIDVKARYKDGDVPSAWAISVGTEFSGTSVVAYYHDDDASGSDWGVGASYDLGGGASVKGGVTIPEGGDASFDFGIAMSF